MNRSLSIQSLSLILVGTLALVCLPLSSANAPIAPEAGFKVKEIGNKIEITSPWGVKSYETDFHLGAMKHYKIEIPLEDLRPAAKPEIDRPETPRDLASTPPPEAPVTPPPAPVPSMPGSCQMLTVETKKPEEPERKPAAIPDTPSEYDSTDRLILEANHLYNRGKFYEASVYVEELIRKNPMFVRAWVMKGSLLYIQGYSDLAKKAWNKASELDPGDPQVRDILKRYP